MKKGKFTLILCMLIIATQVHLFAQSGSSIVVTTNQDVVDDNDSDVSLREAILNASSGATITFSNNFFTGGDNNIITLDPSLGHIAFPENMNMTITGPVDSQGEPTITVRVAVTAKEAKDDPSLTATLSRLFFIQSGTLTMSNLALKGGDISPNGHVTNGHGGILYVNGYGRPITLNNIIFSEAKANDGGAIWCDGGGQVTVNNSRFEDNEGDFNGGAIYSSSGSVWVNTSVFLNNITKNEGGAYYGAYSAKAYFDGVLFDSNISTVDGGAIHNANSSSTEVYNSTFYNNSAKISGGAIHNANECSQLIVNSTFIANNTLYDGGVNDKNNGGAVFNTNNADLTIVNSTFVNNSTLNQGGGVYNVSRKPVYILNSVLVGNSSNKAGANLFTGKTDNQQNSILHLAGSIYGNDDDVQGLTTNISNTQSDAANVFGSDAPSMETDNTVRIEGSGKAAYMGTLVGQLSDGSYFYRNGDNWESLNSSDTAPFVVSTGGTFGLESLDASAVILNLGQNQVSRVQIHTAYNAGAFALNPETPTAVVNDNNDVINPFDQLITLRETVEVYTGMTFSNINNTSGTVGTDITFDTSYFTVNGTNNTIVLDLGRDIPVEKELTITGPRGTGGNIVTVKVPITYSEASDGTASNFRVFTVSNKTDISNLNLQGGDVSANEEADNKNAGGAILLNTGAGESTLTNLSITDGKAAQGGGIYLATGAKLTNLLIAQNTATSGGAIYNAPNATTTVTNATIAMNTATEGGAIYNSANTAMAVQNSIVYYNGENVVTNLDNESFFNSLVETLTTGDVNQNIPNASLPMFVSETEGDFHLMPCSPAVNNGLNSFNTVTTDLDGNARVYGSAIDLGVYELQEAPSFPTAIISASDSTILVGDTTLIRITFPSESLWSFKYYSGEKDSIITENNFNGSEYSYTFKPTQAGSYPYVLTWIQEDGKCFTNLTDTVTIIVNERQTPPDPEKPLLQWSVSTTTLDESAFTDVENFDVTHVVEETPVYVQIRPATDGTVAFDSWKIEYGSSPVELHNEMTPTPANARFTFDQSQPLTQVGEYAFSVTRLFLYLNGNVVGEYMYLDPMYVHNVSIYRKQEPGTDPGNPGIPTDPDEPGAVLPKPALLINAIADLCVSDNEFRIPFNRLNQFSGVEYYIEFANTAKDAGFSDSEEYVPLPANYITVPVTSAVKEGHYQGTIKLRYPQVMNMLFLYPFVINVSGDIEITEQPKSVNASCEGDGFLLSVQATGSNLAYQWYHNELPIAGATDSIFEAALTKEMQGSYFVVVTGACNALESEKVEVRSGGIMEYMKWNDVLYVPDMSRGYVAFQWYKNGEPILQNGTSVYYTDPNGLEGTYHVRTTLKNGSYIESCPMIFDGTNQRTSVSVTPSAVERNSYLTVKIEGPQEDASHAEIEIYDLSGRLSYKGKTNGQQTDIPVNMPTGIYIIKISLESGKVATEKLIVK